MAASVDDLLERVSGSIRRYTPLAAHEAVGSGALLVDIRGVDARERGGVIPGAIHVPRTVLEWRVDPGSKWRNPLLGGNDQLLILICDHGYSSVLAAATLAQLGRECADVVGGFEAWAAAGLPVAPAPRTAAYGLPGMGAQD